MFHVPSTTLVGAVFALAAAGAAAASTPVEIHGHAIAPLTRADAAAIRGTYRMQDGSTLAVAGAGNRLTAEVGRDEPVALLAVSDREFETRDGRFALRFDVHANGVVSGVTLTRR